MSLCAALSQAFPIAAQAQSNYPTKPLRLLVGFSSGGPTDVVARAAAAELAKQLGQAVVVENITGASAHNATLALLAAPANGYTLLLAGLSLATNPTMRDNIGYKPERDLVMVSQLTALSVVMLTRGDSPLNNLQDVVALAKAKNGALKFGSGGAGTTSHLAPELLARKTGFKYTHVPFRGGGPNLQALLAGDIDLMTDLMGLELKAQANAGRIKFLGVMQQEPSPLFPSIKSAGAQGIPSAAFVRSWQGIAVRNGTPAEVVTKLHDAIVSAGKSKEFTEKLEAIGAQPRFSAKPADFQALYRAELARWSALIKAAGINDTP